MTRRSKVWLAGLVVAVLFTLVNLGGGVYAALQGELLHTAVHAGLLVLGASGVRWLASKRDARGMWRGVQAEAPAPPRELADRLTNLEQAVDAVAIEVERIGEGQRFMTRLFTEKGTRRAPGEGAAEPIESTAPEAAPYVRRD